MPAIVDAMSAIAERIDRRLSALPKPRAARLEQLVVELLEIVEPGPQLANVGEAEARRQQALAALDRIAARGGIAGIDDPLAWQREQRADRNLPGREA